LKICPEDVARDLVAQRLQGIERKEAATAYFLERRKLGAAGHPIVIARRHLSDLPFAVKEALQVS